jgi:hypothetical protein
MNSEDNNTAGQGRWISGAEVMSRYNMHVSELGLLCSEGKLTAYNNETLRPVKEGRRLIKYRNMCGTYFFSFLFEKCDRFLSATYSDAFAIYEDVIGKLLFLRDEVSRALCPAVLPEHAAPPIDELTPHIVAWEAVLPKLNSSDKVAALLAIEKWQGRTHAEAYDAVCDDTVVASKIQYVSKNKHRAKKIAEVYGLTMPEWNSSKT